MVELSSLDLSLIERMREAKVLTDVNKKGCRRAAYVGCPDCDKLNDKFRHHGRQVGQKPHPVAAMHGGGAAFNKKSPLNGPVTFPWDWFCYKINEAFHVKDTCEVAWYIHAPCGAAYEASLNLAHLVELSLTNRGYFVEHMQRTYEPRIVVTPYIHIDFDHVRGTKVRRTYELDPACWLEFREEVGDYLSELPYRMPITAAA